MNAVLRSAEPPPETTSDKIAAVGRTWGRLFGIEECDIEAFAAAYQERIETPSVWWVRGTLNGHDAVIARLGDAHVLSTPAGIRVANGPDLTLAGRKLALVAAGKRWRTTQTFKRKRRARWPLDRGRTETQFDAAAAAISERAIHPAEPSRILLTSFSRWARELANTLAHDDLKHAFCAVMSPDDMIRMQLNADQTGHVKGHRAFASLRPKFYIRMIGAALRELRSVFPEDVRKTLWSIGVPDIRLANWLMESERHRLYRIQALKAQPLLLPTALLGPPVQQEKCHGALALRSLTEPLPHVSDADMRVVHELGKAIDEGRPWFDLLARTLAIPGVRRYHGHQADPLPIEAPHVRWLASRSTGFLRWTRHHGSDDLAHYLQIAMSFPGNRKPTTKSQWAPFVEFLDALQMPRGEVVPAAFLKGMPCCWTDPEWPLATKRLSLVYDALEWALGEHMLAHHLSLVRWLASHSTLRQMLNFSDTAHALREEVVASIRREYPATQRADICWEPCVLSGPFAHGPLKIVELTNGAELDEEGERLSHCVADYEAICVMGHSRIFSVRNSNGHPLSTFELRQDQQIDSDVRRVYLNQHFGFKNKQPTPEAEQALEAFFEAARNERILISLNWPHDEHPADRLQSERRQRIATAVSAEIKRRWPDCPVPTQPTHTDDSQE